MRGWGLWIGAAVAAAGGWTLVGRVEHGPGPGGSPEKDRIASPMGVGGRMAPASSSSSTPPPRIAAYRSPVARLVTTEASGPSASTAQSDAANHGRPSEALVEPSTGSTTTVISPSPVSPDSSDRTRNPSASSGSNITSSATMFSRRSPDELTKRSTRDG